MSATSELLTTFLVNSFWQIPLIAASAALCSRLIRRAPSVYRHVVWVTALGLCIGLPLSSLWNSASSINSLNPASSQVSENGSGEHYGQGNLAHKSFSFIRQNHIRPVAFTPLLTWILVGCYVGFFLYRAARIVWSLQCTLKFRDAGYPRALPGPLSAMMKRCASAFALQDVVIICSPDAFGPVTLSFPRPTLILPERFFTEVSEPDFSSALCHELAHIQRHDFVLNLLYELVSVPVSFHPAVVWLKNRIALTRELACDEAAAAKLATRRGYARSLLNIAQSLSSRSSQAHSNLALGLFDTNTLEERIMNMLAKPNRIGRKWGVVLAVVASSLLTVTSVGISAFSFQVAQPTNASGDVKQFVGTWTAVHEGTPFLILDLHLQKGTLGGGIRVCSFNLDMKGGSEAITITDKTLIESLPIRNLEISGKSLSFDWKDPDGDEDHLKLEVTGTDAGRLHWVGLPDGLKVAPIPVTREAAKTR